MPTECDQMKETWICRCGHRLKAHQHIPRRKAGYVEMDRSCMACKCEGFIQETSNAGQV